MKTLFRFTISIFLISASLPAQETNSTATTNPASPVAAGDTDPEVAKASFEFLQQKAEAGDAQAQADLGLLYKSGIEVTKDTVKAIQWFQKSAEQGNANGEREFAMMLHWIDKTDAIKWLTKAADQGDSKAKETLLKWQPKEHHQTPIADATKVSSSTTDRTYVDNIAWVQQKAEAGDADAQDSLGMYYKHGTGVKKDMVKAIQWFQKSAEQGNAVGERNFACELHGFDGDAAKVWLTKAANHGDAFSKELLNGWYLNKKAEPDGVVIQKDNSIKIKEPLSVIAPDQKRITPEAAKPIEQVTRPITKLLKDEPLKFVSIAPPHTPVSVPVGSALYITDLSGGTNINVQSGFVQVCTTNNTLRAVISTNSIEKGAVEAFSSYTNKLANNNKTSEENEVNELAYKYLKEEEAKSSPTWKIKREVREEVDKLIKDYEIKETEMFNRINKISPNDGKKRFSGDFIYHLQSKNVVGDILQSIQTLQVPIKNQTKEYDNSTVIAVANALNYIYTKKEGHPVSVSIPFLIWAHDMQPFSDDEIKNKVWVTEQTKYFSDEPECGIDEVPKEWENNELTPNDNALITAGMVFPTKSPRAIILRGEARKINLEQLLKGVQRFGVCNDAQMSEESYIKGLPPSNDAIAQALDRKNSANLVVKCFNGWNNSSVQDKNRHSNCADAMDASYLNNKENINRKTTLQGDKLRELRLAAEWFNFIKSELANDRPVIETNLTEGTEIIGEPSPVNGIINKRNGGTEHKKISKVYVTAGLLPVDPEIIAGVGFPAGKLPILREINQKGEVETIKNGRGLGAIQDIAAHYPWRNEKRYELYSIGLN